MRRSSTCGRCSIAVKIRNFAEYPFALSVAAQRAAKSKRLALRLRRCAATLRANGLEVT